MRTGPERWGRGGQAGEPGVLHSPSRQPGPVRRTCRVRTRRRVRPAAAIFGSGSRYRHSGAEPPGFLERHGAPSHAAPRLTRLVTQPVRSNCCYHNAAKWTLLTIVAYSAVCPARAASRPRSRDGLSRTRGSCRKPCKIRPCKFATARSGEVACGPSTAGVSQSATDVRRKRAHS